MTEPLAVEATAARLRRREVEVAPTLADKLADRGLPSELVAEAERLESEAGEFRRLTHAAGTLTLTDAAKVIEVTPKRLVNWMIGNDWIYRESKDRLAAHQRRLDTGLLRQRVVRLYRLDGSEKLGVSVLVTAKGLVALSRAIHGREGAP